MVYELQLFHLACFLLFLCNLPVMTGQFLISNGRTSDYSKKNIIYYIDFINLIKLKFIVYKKIFIKFVILYKISKEILQFLFTNIIKKIL